MAAVPGQVSWADLEGSLSSRGASSSAVRARWADLAEEEERQKEHETAAPQGAAEATCGAPGRDLDAASDCSTSADDGAELLRERCAELASDEEETAPAAAAPAATEKDRSAGRRVGRAAPGAQAAAQRQHRGGGADGGSSRAATQRQHWGGWADGGSSRESWGACGPRDSWKGAPRRQRRHGAAGAGGKRQCQFTIGIEEEPRFRVVRRLIGEHGKHVKRIAEASGAKLRLRGRGSGFLEGPEQEESGDPLMMCVSAPDERSYGIVVRLLREHLGEVYEQHRAAYPGAADVRVDLHQGPREGSC